MSIRFPRIASFKTVDAFRSYVRSLGIEGGIEDSIEMAPGSPLAQPLEVDGFRIGNRFVIHPMEGWDGEEDGNPSEFVFRRWRNFGRSGAKWIWGGEAMAVVPDARANPRQLIISEDTESALGRLREALVEAHRESFGDTSDLLVGFQLTHSGRFSKPFRNDRPEPKILYRHPLLDRKFRLPADYPILSDSEIGRIIEAFIGAARIAERAGAQFVDVKHCHGYLGHEFLSAYTRPGPYGGSFENRTRFLREIVEGIRAATRLKIGVRLSAFDMVSFHPDPTQGGNGKLGPGIPDDFSEHLPYRYGFGVRENEPVAYDLSETLRFLELLVKLEIRMLNVTAGSPYYNPHIQRPALFPPSDGYQPPEDPLVGCFRQIEATAELKRRFPQLVMAGTAYTYFQDFLPHIAQHAVRHGLVDTVGLGRLVLSYPELPRDVLEKGQLDGKRLCRTFSDCTTGPRNGLISGCYPLDPYYKGLPEADRLKQIKAAAQKA